jgi:hypothetical protein
VYNAKKIAKNRLWLCAKVDGDSWSKRIARCSRVLGQGTRRSWLGIWASKGVFEKFKLKWPLGPDINNGVPLVFRKYVNVGPHLGVCPTPYALVDLGKGPMELNLWHNQRNTLSSSPTCSFNDGMILGDAMISPVDWRASQLFKKVHFVVITALDTYQSTWGSFVKCEIKR